MNHDLWLLLVGAGIGLVSAIIGAYVKHVLTLRAEWKRNKWKTEEQRAQKRAEEFPTDPARWFPDNACRPVSPHKWTDLLANQLSETGLPDNVQALIHWQQLLAEELWQMQEERVRDLVCLLADLEELEPGIMASSGSLVVDKIMESQRKRVRESIRKQAELDALLE